jgi:hypothetical protein
MEDAVRKFACLLVATLLIGSGCGGGGGGGGNSTRPLKPVADAGTSQTVPVNVLVQLDGSRSISPSGGLLTYQWTLVSKPAGSASTLNNGTVANPTFTPDTTGLPYVLRLVVNDGVSDSDFDEVTITAVAGNIAPVADAGPDQNVVTGATVTLDGSGSHDANGDPITYSWRTIARPAGSNPALSALTYLDRAETDFTPDVAGNYIFGLTVTDNNAASSSEDNVTITVQAGNVPPVADAGTDQNVVTGAPVTLDGSGSHDANGDPITYSWTIISKPAGSFATLWTPLAVQTMFTADVSGSYVFALVVTDNGSAASDPSTVMISADRLASISVSPLDWLTTLGFSVQYSALGTYEIAGQKVDLTNAVTWTSDNTLVATIDGTGFAVTVSEGVTIIRASYAGVSPFSTTLRVGDVSLVSLEIVPPSVTLKVGTTTQLQLLGHRSDGSVIDLTELADWSASFGGVSVIYVDNRHGNKGFVTTFGTGAASVHATYQGLNADVPVNVTN